MAPEIERLVERVLRDVGMELVAPVDVRLLAARLGLAVRFDSIPGARGLLRMEHRRPTVVIEQRLSRTDTRFTLSHEIGHWVLAAYPAETRAIWEARPGLRDAERFCDSFAGALLLPFMWTQAFLAEDDERVQSLDLLLRLARRADVSPPTAVIRVTRIARWRRLLLHIRGAGLHWKVLSASGYKRGPWRYGVDITPDVARRLAQLMEAGSGYQPDRRDWVALRAGNWACHVPSEIRWHGTSAFMCIAPDHARADRPSVELRE